MLHVNIEKMMSQQKWYLLLNCSIVKFAFPSTWHMSSKYSTKQCASSQYCDKQMSEIWCKNV